MVARRIAAELPASPHLITGHSFGGLLALEAALAAHESGRPGPRAVVVMASRPPRQGTDALFRPVLALEDAPFAEAMARLGAMDPAILDHPALSLFVGPLRTDIGLICGYTPQDRGLTLAVPLHVWLGRTDPLAPPSMADAWRGFAGAGFASRIVDGDHAFPTTHAPQVAAWLTELAQDSTLSE